MGEVTEIVVKMNTVLHAGIVRCCLRDLATKEGAVNITFSAITPTSVLDLVK